MAKLLSKSEKKAPSAAREKKRLLARHPARVVDQVLGNRSADIQKFRMDFPPRCDPFSWILCGYSTISKELRRAAPESEFRSIFERLASGSVDRINQVREWVDGRGPFANTDLSEYFGIEPGRKEPVVGALTPQVAEPLLRTGPS